jgi:hypothetical protein
MEWNEWLSIGVTNGWVSLPICVTHEGIPSTPEEDVDIMLGEEICMYCLRVWV